MTGAGMTVDCFLYESGVTWTSRKALSNPTKGYFISFHTSLWWWLGLGATFPLFVQGGSTECCNGDAVHLN